MIYEWRTPVQEDGTYYVVGDQAHPRNTYYIAKGPSNEKTDSGIQGLRKAMEIAIMRSRPKDGGEVAFKVNFDGSSK